MEIANKPRSIIVIQLLLLGYGAPKRSSIELNRAPLKGIKGDFFQNFPDFKIDSILAIFGVFAPFPGV